MSERTFVIRVDSSSEIGMGHLARCLALANYLIKLKAKVIFICRDHYGSAHELILKQKFRLHLLNGNENLVISSKPSDWLGFSQLQDASESSAFIAKYPGAHVIVDHYGLDYLWESNIKCDSMTVIDDLANRPHQCSLLIDQSLQNTKLDYEKLIDGNFDFIGGNIIILRDEFSSGKTWKAPGSGKVLICMGGADPQSYTRRILEQIVFSHKKYSGHPAVSEINVIVGTAFTDYEALKSVVNSTKLNVSILSSPENISELMLTSDLCILSCGTMIFEACALGVPSIGVAVADNQQSTADFLDKAGAIKLYDFKSETDPKIYATMSSLINDTERLYVYSTKLKTMVSLVSNETIARSLYQY
ncbi:UDP-2,4-diacetamido-2,4,6-trideoxy-beta-L-altropyranose hydrolase [Alphaproteobacteria bacterium]|nr:UDP-2,4-diacetamido-2,4,6-trideoxy-beta-L-altropyranose hydrolase [Alphaproteobacteria bacterium]